MIGGQDFRYIVEVASNQAKRDLKPFHWFIVGFLLLNLGLSVYSILS